MASSRMWGRLATCGGLAIRLYTFNSTIVAPAPPSSGPAA